MLSVLIVDDDRLMVEKLEESVGWEKCGVGTVLTAGNIRQAKKLLEEAPVDILLSDIEMPQGSGLELLEWVREKKLGTECIFLSSYAYFAYAQKAICLQSFDYLLKPVSSRDLEDVLARLAEKVRRKKGTQEAEDAAQRRQNFWREYLFQNAMMPTACQRAEREGDFAPEGACRLALLRLLPGQAFKNREDVVLHRFILENITQDFFKGGGSGSLLALIGRSDYEYFLIFDVRGAALREETLAAYQNCLEKTLHGKSLLYLGKEEAQKNAAESRRRLEEMAKEAVPGESGILSQEDWLCPRQAEEAPPWRQWERELLEAEGMAVAQEHITAYLRGEWERGALTVSVLRRFRRGMVQLLDRCLNARGVLSTQIFDEKEFEAQYDRAVYTLTAMEDFVRFTCGRLAGYFHQDTRQERIVQAIRQYIDDHLREELSRRELAGLVFLSEDYVSRLFAQTTGMSIPAYITSRRMQRAEEYLRGSDLSVSKVALEVGYSNFSYFSKSFKDYAGCTPNEFRARRKP